MTREQPSSWNANEKEYADYLAHERHMFAWCLVTHGGFTHATALARAEQRYPYEAPTEPHRGLVFHDEAWHWAMLTLFGEQYWRSRPELQSPSADYRTESTRHEHPNA